MVVRVAYANAVLAVRRLCSFRKNLPRLTLFTKDSCPLCDDALKELRAYEYRYQLEKVDIALPENKRWYKEYRFDIPVFHLNGRFLMKHRVDHEKLNQELFNLEQARAKADDK